MCYFQCAQIIQKEEWYNIYQDSKDYVKCSYNR